MRAKPVMLLAVALGCGTVAAIAATQVIKDQGKSGPAMQMVDIWLPPRCGRQHQDYKRAIQVGDLAGRPDARRSHPRHKSGRGKVHQPTSLSRRTAPRTQSQPSNESIAQTIPAGCKVFDLPVDANNGGVGYIQPGHRVDIHGFFEKSGRILESKSILVMENVEVLMVDGVAVRDQEEGNSRRAGTIQLLIRASQYEALNTARIWVSSPSRFAR